MRINEPTIAGDGGVRATWAEIDLGRLKANLGAIRAHVAPAKVMPILKANAYGHGLAEAARFLDPLVDYIGVAVLEEGIFLRRLGVKAPILVLGGIWGDQIPQYLRHNLTLTASSVERLEQIAAAAAQMKTRAKVHLKVDTGMERIGVHYYNAEALQETALRSSPNVEVEGIFSHFANADAADLSHARLQVERFNEVLRFYETRSLPMPVRHMANSAAILQLPESLFDMVRPGIMLYGVYPSPGVPRTIPVRPALAWRSRVVYFKVVQPGHPVSYGSAWQSDHPVRIVTVPVGYGDGYFRAMSNQAEVIIRGKRYPQVGRICMDQMMVNIEWDSAYNGDVVTLLGEADGASVTAEDLAGWAGTIPYEILTNINTRVPRVYLTEDNQPYMESSQPVTSSRRITWQAICTFFTEHWRDYLYLLLVAGAVIGLDQWTKALVRANIPLGSDWLPESLAWLAPYARIRHWYNTGAAFGMFKEAGILFMILAIVVAGVILYYFPKISRKDWYLRLALGLQLGGAIGNLIDRILFDFRVTDFISVGTFPVLNLADASISVGVAVLLLGAWLKEREAVRAARAAQAAAQAPTDESAKGPGEATGE